MDSAEQVLQDKQESKIDDQQPISEDQQELQATGNNRLREEILNTLKTTGKIGGGKDSEDYTAMQTGVEKLIPLLQTSVRKEEAMQSLSKLLNVYTEITSAAENYVKTHTTAFTHRGRVRRRNARALLNLCRNDMQILSQADSKLMGGGSISWWKLLSEGNTGAGQQPVTVDSLIAEKDVKSTGKQIAQSSAEMRAWKDVLSIAQGFSSSNGRIMPYEQLQALVGNNGDRRYELIIDRLREYQESKRDRYFVKDNLTYIIDQCDKLLREMERNGQRKRRELYVLYVLQQQCQAAKRRMDIK